MSPGDFIGAYWGTILIVTLGVAAWAAALWVVFTRAKFKRKWLWALLASVSSTFWDTSIPGLSVGAPLFSIYVLWFARFGPTTDRPRQWVGVLIGMILTWFWVVGFSANQVDEESVHVEWNAFHNCMVGGGTSVACSASAEAAVRAHRPEMLLAAAPLAVIPPVAVWVLSYLIIGLRRLLSSKETQSGPGRKRSTP